ncbi:MAG: hypothetical protein EOM26_06155 [Alphaproteobacteria bacterium]|nr:hypothetical protein [Alphaproteobacteria bacterium]
MLTYRKNSDGSCWRATRVLTTVLSIVVFALAFSAGSAWSLDNTLRMNDPALYSALTKPDNKKPTPSSVAEACLPLLQSSLSLPVSATDGRRSAGAAKVAVLGLVFGAQFALAPSTTRDGSASVVHYPSKALNMQSDDQIDGASRVLAVAAYRNCVKKQALKELSSLRWER